MVTTLAGSVNSGYSDGYGNNAKLSTPCALELHNGSLYIVECSGRKIRKVTVAGTHFLLLQSSN